MGVTSSAKRGEARRAPAPPSHLKREVIGVILVALSLLTLLSLLSFVPGEPKVVATPNAESPMAQGIKCLLTVDVWEHAYYVDYRNERERYVSAVMDRLNWEFAEKNLG